MYVDREGETQTKEQNYKFVLKFFNNFEDKRNFLNRIIMNLKQRA